MLVSTIIPTYNRSQDVQAAVESALAQTYPADLQEILVIDDGSTDGTKEALSRFGSRIRYAFKENGGVAAARNVGIELALGSAIAFLDSDDRWVPDKIARQVAVLEARPKIGLVLTGIRDVNPDGTLRNAFSRRSNLPEDGHLLKYVLRNPAMCPSSALVRTAVVRSVGAFDPTLRTAEDLDLHLRIALRHQIAVIDEPLVLYRRCDDGLGGELRTYADAVAVMERFLGNHREEIPRAQQNEALVGAYLRGASGLLNHHEFGDATRLAMKGLQHSRRLRDVRALAGFGFKFARVASVRTVRRLWGRRVS